MGDHQSTEESAAERPKKALRKGLLGLALLIGAIATLSVVFAVAYWGGQHDAINKIRDRYVLPVLERLQPAQDSDTRTIEWRDLSTHFHTLQRADIQLSPRGAPAIWALGEVGDNILFASRLGQFGYLDSANAFHALDLQADMGLEALRQSPLHNDPVFQISELRVFDLLVAPAGPNAYDLFVSHVRFAGSCFQVVVSRTRLQADGAEVRPTDGRWDDIYVARPCMEIKERGMRFAGHEGGGRLALLNPTTLLLTVGTFQFDGVVGDYVAGQDRETDLGKIIEISIPARTGRIYALGVRNPQGLTIARDGRIWETEHGPMGGDEVNLIRRNTNYGWPQVTYGLEYGGLPWPHNPQQGLHRGYTPPAFAFMPSIGISNIIEPDTQQFPLWDERLITASLYGNSLFILKTEGDQIVYSEEVPMGERMRDIITLHDGRIAIITDGAKLILLRNAELNADAPRSFAVTGLNNLPQVLPEEREPATPELLGARLFHYNCGTCHSTTGEVMAGPPLDGLIGRDIGSVEGFPYTPALENADGAWTRGRLRAFLNHSDPALAGTVMPRIELYDDQFRAIYAYLESTRATLPQGDRR